MAKWRACQDCGQRASGKRCRACADVALASSPKSARACQRCGQQYVGPHQQRHCMPCRTMLKKEYARKKYRDNPEHRQRRNETTRLYHEQNQDRLNEARREYASRRHLARKLEAIRRYGPSCACCGEDRYQFLTVDHSNHDGAQHRALITGDARKGGAAFYLNMERAGWPDWPGLRILCANCHMAIDLWGGCPHSEYRAKRVEIR
jgi:hypothetical protein